MKGFGRWVTRRIHGNERGPGGLLLTRRHYLEDDQEWQLGLCYAMLLGYPAVFASIIVYVELAYSHLRVVRGGRSSIRLGHWADLSLDMKILIPLLFILFPFAAIAFIRCFFVLRPQIAEQHRSDIGA